MSQDEKQLWHWHGVHAYCFGDMQCYFPEAGTAIIPPLDTTDLEDELYRQGAPWVRRERDALRDRWSEPEAAGDSGSIDDEELVDIEAPEDAAWMPSSEM